MTFSNNALLDYSRPEELLQRLIRFNTTNPPGDEAECIKFIRNILEAAGLEVELLSAKPERLNLVARLKGQGTKPPLLMYGHADVVTAEHQNWSYPPFEGILADECIWGRGALDMKGALSMMICALIRAKAENYVPMGDIILCIVSDEEDTGAYGAKFVVENYPELFKDVKYAIGEIGGFTMWIGDKKFYPIMVSEKQRCGIRATFKGQGGHGSLPLRNGSMAKLSAALDRLNTKRLPVHITPPVKMMIEALASKMAFPTGSMMKALLNPALTDTVLNIMGDKGRVFDAILHNTINATIVNGGNKINVIPSEITLDCDVRLLPGISIEELVRELKVYFDKDTKLEVLFYEKGPDSIDMEMYDVLSQILTDTEKDAIPIPFVVSGVTDARFFTKLGIQTYGFTPMLLPKGLDFSSLIHSSNERVPVTALRFGAESIYSLIKRM